MAAICLGLNEFIWFLSLENHIFGVKLENVFHMLCRFLYFDFINKDKRFFVSTNNGFHGDVFVNLRNVLLQHTLLLK